VLFMQDYKVQHKKVVLVDNETVWLGSANLTLNALAYNEEMSLRTSDREVARQAAADYAEMRKRASRDAQ
jgi:phosphatidylserine/phosphatidylglycerophosphate/cardiolipin synthase-like enzyme